MGLQFGQGSLGSVGLCPRWSWLRKAQLGPGELSGSTHVPGALVLAAGGVPPFSEGLCSVPSFRSLGRASLHGIPRTQRWKQSEVEAFKA